jgi:alpha-L-fucosidase
MRACFQIVSAAALVLTLAAVGFAQKADDGADPRLDWWRDARFGMFIHWGLYAIPAGQWGEQTNHAEWIMNTAHIPVEQYEQYVDQFNPAAFDADEWARMAKEAGMRYIVITSKHHDGFALFDSAVSDYDVMATPFKRDIMKELAEACRKQGIRICWYHSIMDWHHPDYLPRRGWETRSAEGADFDRYVEYLRGQVTELLTNYGPIGVMWFDGAWEGTWTHEYGQPLYDLCRSLQPDVIVNDRVDKGRRGHTGLVAEGFAGDYGTPEQHIPDAGLPGVDWETCMTMNRHWGYNSHDTDWKSTEDLVRKLVDIASKNGNFLLNIGPKADGTFPEEAVTRLREIGRWMDVNGQSIYGTTASPFGTLPWGRCTAKWQASGDGGQTSLYLHVFDWPSDGRLVVPGLGNPAISARLLADPSFHVRIHRRDSDLVLTLPAEMPDPICTVVRLDISGKPIVYRQPTINAPSRVLVRPLTVTIDAPGPELIVRYTTDGADPSASSPLYEGPIRIAETTEIRARTFHKDKPVSGVAVERFERVEPMPAVRVTHALPGLERIVYAGDWDVLPDFDALTPESVGEAREIDLGPDPHREYYGQRLNGYLRIPADDAYTFALAADDGAKLWIDGTLVVDNDGLHGVEEKTGVVPLARGTHAIRVEYFNKTGGSALKLRYAPAGQSLKPIPLGMYIYKKAEES